MLVNGGARMAVFFAFVAIFILFVMLANTRTRLKQTESTLAEAAKRIGALQRQIGLLPPKPGETFAENAVPPVATPAESVAAPSTDYERWKPKPVEEPVADVEPVENEPVAEDTPVEATPTPVMAAASAPLPSISQDVPADDETTQPVEAVEAVEEPVAPEPAPASAAPDETPPPPPSPPEPPRSMASRFENLFGKTLPIWAGGITLAIAGVLIVKYAIDAGFFGRIFTPPVQIVAGLLFGLGLIGGAEFAFRNEHKVRDMRVPQALSGAGLATLYAAILVAANVYTLIGPLPAFIALAVVTAAALGLSLRFGAPSALLGLAGGLAAPALVGATEPNIPLLSVYLGLTIAGLAGVSRMRRWPWLALAALVGGAGWSLFMVLATDVLDTLGSLSVGGFVLLLAIALPMLAFDGPRSALLRSASAIVGALQLALLVGYGGFTPLHWGLFALIAAAGQWLAWRNRAFAIVPTIGAALSVLLLAAWPDPTSFWFATIALSLAAIHALPLLAHLWKAPPDVQRTWELCGIAVAAPLLTRWQFQEVSNTILATVALGGALLPATGIALGWRVENRTADTRFAWLTITAGALLALAIALILPEWMAPLAIGAVAAALLFFGKAAGDRRIEPIATGFAGAALIALLATQPLHLSDTIGVWSESGRLWSGTDAALTPESVIRWLAMAALAGLFAAKADKPALRFTALSIVGVLTYGTLAQIVPAWSLTLAMAAVTLALFALAQRRTSTAIETLSAAFAGASVLLLASTGPELPEQWSRLAASDAAVGLTSILRWAGLTALFGLFAWRASNIPLRLAAHAATAFIGYGLLAQFVPGWSLPLSLGAIAAALLLIGERGSTGGVRWLSGAVALATLPLLILSAENSFAEWSRLWGHDAEVTALSAIRWGGLALLALLYAVRVTHPVIQRAAQVATALLAYGAFAQSIPGAYLMLVPAIAGAALLLATRRIALARIDSAALTFATLGFAWAAEPLAAWSAKAGMSLAGLPMTLDVAALGLDAILLRLLVPALLFGSALVVIRDTLPRHARMIGLSLAALIAGIAFHCLYRIGFAAAFGGDFVATGLGQRLLWDALLIGTGWLALWRGQRSIAMPLAIAGCLHTLWYSLLLYNPLWSEQAVGALPVANLLIPLFAMLWLGLTLIGLLWPDRPVWTDRIVQFVTMLLVGGFAWATLRQIYHGTLLVDPGTFPTENILRSILILALAIGFLLWGIRSRRHDWRIASLLLMLGAVAKVFLFDASGLEGLLRIGSFVALGFSLIGIGWLYSRQLAGGSSSEGDDATPAPPSAPTP